MIKYANTQDLIAAITGLYAYRSTAFDIAIKELKTRMPANEFASFCKSNGFVIY